MSQFRKKLRGEIRLQYGKFVCELPAASIDPGPFPLRPIQRRGVGETFAVQGEKAGFGDDSTAQRCTVALLELRKPRFSA